MINISIQWVRTRTDIDLQIVGYSFPYALPMYVASYDKLKQIHMQVLFNCHLAAFCTVPLILKYSQMTI